VSRQGTTQTVLDVTASRELTPVVVTQAAMVGIRCMDVRRRGWKSIDGSQPDTSCMAGLPRRSRVAHPDGEGLCCGTSRETRTDEIACARANAVTYRATVACNQSREA
jgi:hypothetical protein